MIVAVKRTRHSFFNESPSDWKRLPKRSDINLKWVFFKTKEMHLEPFSLENNCVTNCSKQQAKDSEYFSTDSSFNDESNSELSLKSTKLFHFPLSAKLYTITNCVSYKYSYE